MIPDAFAAETLPHLVEIRRAARRYAPWGGDEDLAQETFLRALQARHRYTPGTNARAWLYRILANTAHSAHRREVRDRRLCERLAVSLPGCVVDPPLVERQLGVALAALPAEYRRVIELADLEGRSYRQIAEALAVPLGTVMSRLHRARLRLRRGLATPPPPRRAALH